jgi:predicted nucleic acid-binding protein
MVTTVADSILVDTNVLVYATAPSSPFHQQAVAALHRLSQRNAEVWISRQVLREYLVQLTRPGVLPQPIAGQTASRQLAALSRMYRVADENDSVTTALLQLVSQGLASGKQVHDANVVATCIAFGIRRVLTNNGAHFKRFSQFVAIDEL